MFDPMKLRHLAFEGPDIDDYRTLRRLPGPLRDILRTLNGFIAFDGGFHVRGALPSTLMALSGRRHHR